MWIDANYPTFEKLQKRGRRKKYKRVARMETSPSPRLLKDHGIEEERKKEPHNTWAQQHSSRLQVTF